MRLLAVAILLAIPAFSQDFSNLVVETFASGLTYSDGPVWLATGELVFSDVPSNEIYHVKMGEKVAPLRQDAGGPMGGAVDAQGRLYTCEARNRRVVRVDRKGQLEVLAGKWQGKRLNAPNDIAIRRDGNLYFTDPAFGSQQDSRELDFYGVYHLSPSGQLELVARPKGRPNGIAVSPDGKLLYVTNSDERNVRVYELDRKGEASKERVLIPDVEGIPNGIRTDEEGNLYVAAKSLFVYTKWGQKIAAIGFEHPPSNCVFGDDDMRTLYVTARSNIYRVRMPVKGWSPDSQH